MTMKKTLTLNEKDPVQKEALRIISKRYGTFFSKDVADAIVFYEQHRTDGTYFEDRIRNIIRDMMPEICAEVSSNLSLKIMREMFGEKTGGSAETHSQDTNDENSFVEIGEINYSDLDGSDIDTTDLEGL